MKKKKKITILAVLLAQIILKSQFVDSIVHSSKPDFHSMRSLIFLDHFSYYLFPHSHVPPNPVLIMVNQIDASLAENNGGVPKVDGSHQGEMEL